MTEEFNKYVIEYPNEPYFVKSELKGDINEDNSELESNSIKLLKFLDTISTREQPEAMGLYPLLQEVELDSQEFYNAMIELVYKKYVVVDHSTAPARTLIVAKA